MALIFRISSFLSPRIGSSTAEQGAHNSLVTGSNPVRSTIVREVVIGLLHSGFRLKYVGGGWQYG
jgi:hypothetical protein